jgi:hypothetical protein
MGTQYIVNPHHGGKVTCHKCNGFIIEESGIGYYNVQHSTEFPNTWFHQDCYNPYEHYYGLDRPID